MYQYKIKRYVLEKIRNGYKNNLSKNDIVKRIGEIEGTKKEQDQLLKDCMIYVFLDEIFNSSIENRERAINLAIRYLQRNEAKGNIVKEKLLSFYRRTSQIEKAKSLAAELLEEEPNNVFTVSKYIVLLRIEGKDEEALQFIEQQEDEIKNSPAIFNLKYRILLKRKDLNGCIQLVKDNILKLEVDMFAEKDKKKFIEQLYRYKGQLSSFDKVYLNEEDRRIAISRIMSKVRKERGRSFGEQIDEGRLKNAKDLELVKKMNDIICTKRELLTAEDMKREAEEIQNRLTKSIMNWQIEHLYGEDCLKISREAKRYLEEIQNPSEEEKKIIRVLVNFLTSKNGKFYKHNNWVQIQKTYFKQLIGNKKVEKDKTIGDM